MISPTEFATSTPQKTLKKATSCIGIGAHKAQKTTLEISPAPAGTGIVFVRKDLGKEAPHVKACWSNVVDTRFSTTIALPYTKAGVTRHAAVQTVEHLMAAFYACEIDNAVVTLDGPEIPIMDGSSTPFIDLFEAAGTALQNAPRSFIKVLKSITVGTPDRRATISPADHIIVDYELPFGERAPHLSQRFHFKGGPSAFRNKIAMARTFGFLEDGLKMKAAGLAQGSSLDNAIVIDDEGQIMNPEGIRCDAEMARHKILDATGDLFLAGCPIIGHFEGVRSGHDLNIQLVTTLMEDETAWERITPSAQKNLSAEFTPRAPAPHQPFSTAPAGYA